MQKYYSYRFTKSVNCYWVACGKPDVKSFCFVFSAKSGAVFYTFNTRLANRLEASALN